MPASMFNAMLLLSGAALALLAGCHGARPAALGVNRRGIETIRARRKELP